MFSTILFDVDGVMYSEERYFDASALTVYELLAGPRFLNLPIPELPDFHSRPTEDEIRHIRSVVFDQDRVLDFMKSVGINANWDMVYLQFVTQLTMILERIAADSKSEVEVILSEPWSNLQLSRISELCQGLFAPDRISFEQFRDIYSGNENKAQLMQSAEVKFSRFFAHPAEAKAWLAGLWTLGKDTFQEWYLGDGYLPEPVNKVGFVSQEVPIVPEQALRDLFERCQSLGIRLGVATGRPHIETYVPFRAAGFDGYFETRRVTTASDVLNAEQQYPSVKPLSKPHSFSYLRSFLEADDPSIVLSEPIPLAPELAGQVLIVGDSVADWMCAQALGVKFAAVLTGLSGEAAREQFETLGCDYIWSDVLSLSGVLDQLVMAGYDVKDTE
jgi:phosphoglycolate phosphatase-like HAD superfamily hydrolase